MKGKKHQFQRGVCVLLAVMLLLGVTACTPADEGPSQSTQSTTTTAVTTTTTAETTTTATTTTAETKVTTTTTKKKTTTTSPTTTTTKPVVEDTFNYTWNDDGVLKILTVGNSFSDDMMEHVYSIAKDIGIEKIELGNLCYNSCRIEQHYEFWNTQMPMYLYRTNNDDYWETSQNTSIRVAFQTTDWDYISFQESAQQVQSNPELYEHLDELVAMAKERCPNAKIVWHMPWANPHANYNHDTMTMYTDLCIAVIQQIYTRKAFELVIPCGTSIQNVRTSSNGNKNLIRDGWHLSDTGRYIAALTLVKQLTGKSIDGVKWTPDLTTNQMLPIIIEAVNNAVATPLKVTQSSY